MKSGTKVVDYGFNKYIKTMRDLAQGKEVAIGITGDKAVRNVDGDFRLVDVAAVHEFGSLARSKLGEKKVPERSYIRAGIDENRSKIANLVAKVAKEVAFGVIPPESALDRIGVVVASMIKTKIRRGIAPELKESTKREKAKVGGTAKNTPLIRTGRLINSITHVVRNAGSTSVDARSI